MGNSLGIRVCWLKVGAVRVGDVSDNKIHG
jgi:hypothetical protein